MCGEKIRGKAPWSFQHHTEKSELDQSASEDKDPKKLNIWCTKSIFFCFIAVGGTLPSTVCQVQLLHLRESPCFSREFLHQGLHMDFTLNSYWIKDKQCLDWGLELRPLFPCRASQLLYKRDILLLFHFIWNTNFWLLFHKMIFCLTDSGKQILFSCIVFCNL